MVTWEELSPDGTSMKIRYKDETELHEVTQSQDYYNDSDINNKVHITLTSPYNFNFNYGSNITIYV